MIGLTNSWMSVANPNTNFEIVSWKTGSVEQISKMLDAHYAGKINIEDYWAVGDIRKEDLRAISSGTTGESQSAQEITLAIIGFNHDTLKTQLGVKTKGAVTIQTLNCLNTTGYINSSYSGVDKALWSKSQRRTWCNNEFVNALSTLKGLIKPVVKLSNRHADSNYTSYRQQETTEDYAFLLSQWEVWGSQQISSSDYGTLPADGTQYEYMKTSSNRIKSVNGSTNYWWTRSSHVDSGSARFAIVSTDGSYYNDYANYSFGIGSGLRNLNIFPKGIYVISIIRGAYTRACRGKAPHYNFIYFILTFT